MAEVFLARVAGTNQLVAIKRILPYLSHEAEFVRMFLDEARIAAQLDHPNIIQLHELGQLQGSLFIAMEFVDGVDLRKILQEELKRNRAVPYAVAAWITARVCDGLYYAHNRAGLDGRHLQLIHRDVSPQNVMVAYDGRVKLVDFGIARANAFMEQSKPGVIKGKFLYLAPEQLAPEGIDHRADLFAVGTMLYEITTGKSPFSRGSTEAVIFAIRREEPPPPHLSARDYPLELSRIVMKCLAKDRAKRYQQANEIARDLDAFIRAHAPTDAAGVASYIAGLFGDEGERTVLHIPPPPLGFASTGASAQPEPGAQFRDEEDAPPTQRARPNELAEALQTLPSARAMSPARRPSGASHPEAGAAPSSSEATRTLTESDEPSQSTISYSAPTLSVTSSTLSEKPSLRPIASAEDGPAFHRLPARSGPHPTAVAEASADGFRATGPRPSKPRLPVPDEAFEGEERGDALEDEESTIEASTLADRQRRTGGRPARALVGAIGAAVLIILAAWVVRAFRADPDPAPPPTPMPAPPRAADGAAPARDTSDAASIAREPQPVVEPNVGPAANEKRVPTHSVALQTDSPRKTPEKVPVAFKAPRGTTLTAGRETFAVGRIYPVEPGILKVKYRCPGRRGASGTQSFQVEEGRQKIQLLTVSCRRK